IEITECPVDFAEPTGFTAYSDFPTNEPGMPPPVGAHFTAAVRGSGNGAAGSFFNNLRTETYMPSRVTGLWQIPLSAEPGSERCGEEVLVILSPTRMLRVFISGFGQVEFPINEHMAVTQSCSFVDDCVVEVSANPSINVNLIGAVGGMAPRLRDLGTGDCTLNSVVPSQDDGVWVANISLSDASPPICHFEFPETEGMVNVPIRVSGGATVRFGVPGATPATCTAQPPSATCRAEVAPDSAFEVEVVTDTTDAPEVLWGGDCVADGSDPLRAVIPRVRPGSSCELSVQAPSDCGEDPRIDVFSVATNSNVPLTEISYTLAGTRVEGTTNESEPVELSAVIQANGDPTHAWSVSDGSSVTDIGSDNPTSPLRLRCGQSAFCELRYSIDDACGRRTAVALFDVVVP
ncbi:MAG: hypothetical protein AAFU79_32125, partial [Myxococcota bacterium]